MRTWRSFWGWVLPLWPGFLLLINIELAFPKHTTAALDILTWYTELHL